MPTLDLLNILTLAEDILDDPIGKDAKKFARQIIDECSEDMALVAQWASAIRETDLSLEREDYARRIIEWIETLLAKADSPNQTLCEDNSDDMAIPA